MNVSNITQPNSQPAGSIEHVAIAANGAVTYWKTSDTSRDALREALTQASLEDLVPRQREPFSVLRAALLQLCAAASHEDNKYIVLDRKAPKVNGYEVHLVRKESPDYNVVALLGSYKVDEHEHITADLNAFFTLSDVEAVYAHQKGLVPAATVGGVLVKAVQRIGGVCLRPAGGVYWVPQDSLPKLVEVAGALQRAQEGTKVYTIHTVLDDAAIDAVKDALIAEVTAITASIRAELVENKLGKQAVKHRKAQAKYLHDRVARYEGIFGEALESLHAAVAVTEQELKVAEAIDDNNEFFGELYAAPVSEEVSE